MLKQLAIGSVLAVAAVSGANAATYTLSGTGTTITDGTNFTLSNESYTGSGTVDTTGGVFNSATFNYSGTVTSPLDGGVNATITGTLTFADASGSYTNTTASCTDNGTTAACGNVSLGSVAVNASSFDFSNLASLSWTSVESVTSPLGAATHTIDYVATPSAVPLPAAAWLFGSGLVGLAGVARRRRQA